MNNEAIFSQSLPHPADDLNGGTGDGFSDAMTFRMNVQLDEIYR